jgi:hypothetical protein
MKFLKGRLETSNHENTHNLNRFLIYGLNYIGKLTNSKKLPLFSAVFRLSECREKQADIDTHHYEYIHILPEKHNNFNHLS